MEEVLLFNKVFPIVDTCLHCEDSPTKLCDGAQMAIFCVIFASCISSEPRAAHFRPYSKFILRPCGSMVDIQSATAEARKRKEERKKIKTTPAEYNLLRGASINSLIRSAVTTQFARKSNKIHEFRTMPAGRAAPFCDGARCVSVPFFTLKANFVKINLRHVASLEVFNMRTGTFLFLKALSEVV